MKVYLHIGSGKCGSTAIQSTIDLNRDLLSEHGIYIPSPPPGTPDLNIGSIFKKPSPDVFDSFMIALVAAAETHHTAVISWEGFFRFNRHKIKSRLAPLKQFDLQAIFYIRDQAELIQSGLLQKYQSTPYDFQRTFVRPQIRNFLKIADRWSKFCGTQTQVVEFNRNRFPDGDVVRDFLPRIGMIQTEGLRTGAAEVNSSLSLESALALSKVERDLGPTERRNLVQALYSVQDEFEKTKYFYPKEFVTKIRRTYAKSNRKLEKKYNLEKLIFDSECWSSGDSAEQISEDLLARALEVAAVPFLGNHESGLDLYRFGSAGWSPEKENGLLMLGDSARLHFRIRNSRKRHRFSSFRLSVNGHYSGAEQPKLRVLVDGNEVEVENLLSFTVEIPFESLASDEIVKVDFQLVGGADTDSPLIPAGYTIDSLAGKKIAW